MLWDWKQIKNINIRFEPISIHFYCFFYVFLFSLIPTVIYIYIVSLLAYSIIPVRFDWLLNSGLRYVSIKGTLCWDAKAGAELMEGFANLGFVYFLVILILQRNYWYSNFNRAVVGSTSKQKYRQTLTIRIESPLIHVAKSFNLTNLDLFI